MTTPMRGLYHGVPVAFALTASRLKPRPEENSTPPTRQGGVWGTRHPAQGKQAAALQIVVKYDILTVKEASKDGTLQHNQQQGADYCPSRNSESAWTEGGRPSGICRRQGSNDHPPCTCARESLFEVCRGASRLLQYPRGKCVGADFARRGKLSNDENGDRYQRPLRPLVQGTVCFRD